MSTILIYTYHTLINLNIIMYTFISLVGVRLFLSEDNTTLFNFSMISENQFGLNNGLWCQSANTGSTIGTWYLPNGAQVPTEVTDLPVHADHATGQVGLLRDILLDDDYQGLYTCIIPDETDINQTIVVAVYTNTQFGASGMILCCMSTL